MPTPASHVPRPAPPGMLNSDDVAKLLSVSVRTLFRLLKRGQFPQPEVRRRRAILWSREQIDRHLARIPTSPRR